MTYHKRVLFFFLFIPFCLWSQVQNDAGLWLSSKVSFELPAKHTFYVAPEIRLYDNMHQVRSAFADVGVQKKISKHWSAIGEMRIGARSSNELWNYRQRMSLGLQWKEDWGKWEPSILLRQQWGHSNFTFGDWQDVDLSHNTRLKGGMRYTGLDKIDLYTSHELFFNSYTRAYYNWRWQGGIDYNLKNHQHMKLGYLIQRDITNLKTDYVITGGWSYDFEVPNSKEKSAIPKNEQTVLLMNGRTIKGEVMLDSTLLVRLRYTGRYGKMREAELHRSEIFSITNEGVETILYGQDSLLGYTYNIDEMRVFLMGERDAYERYQARHTLISGFLICGTVAFLGQDGFVSAIVPAMLFTLGNVPFKVRCRPHHMSNEALKYNDWYAEGFGPVAKSKRIKRALLSGFVGSASGILLYYCTR